MGILKRLISALRYASLK